MRITAWREHNKFMNYPRAPAMIKHSSFCLVDVLNAELRSHMTSKFFSIDYDSCYESLSKTSPETLHQLCRISYSMCRKSVDQAHKNGWMQCVKATLHSAIFLACKYAIEDTDNVLPSKDGPRCPYW